MRFLLTPDQQQIADLIRPFLAAELPAEKVRANLNRVHGSAQPVSKTAAMAAEQGATKGSVPLLDQQSLAIWRSFASLGVLGGLLPESLNGLGMGLLSAIVTLESCSAPVNHLPIFQTLAHAVLLLSLGAEATGGPSATEKIEVTAGMDGLGDLAAKIAGGELVASGIWLSEGEGLEVTPIQEGDRSRARIRAELFPLLGGPELDVLIIALDRDAGTELYKLDLTAAKAEGSAALEVLPNLDLLRSCSVLSLDHAELQLLAVADPDTASRVQLAQYVLAAAELAGLAQAAVTMTVDYLQIREQFGRPVGTFQALQHKLADMKLAADQATALTRFAGWCFDEGDAQFREAAVAAKAFCSEVVPKVIEQAIQAHGGIGFTFEHDLHLLLRRAKAQSILLGDAKEHAIALAELQLADADAEL